jgi:hypothetical protein
VICSSLVDLLSLSENLRQLEKVPTANHKGSEASHSSRARPEHDSLFLQAWGRRTEKLKRQTGVGKPLILCDPLDLAICSVLCPVSSSVNLEQ